MTEPDQAGPSGPDQPDVLTFGESLVSLRSAGPLASGTTFRMHVAGAESNVAVALARLGHSVSWVGRLGGDELGAFTLRELRAEGVRVDGVRVDPDRPTGLMLLENRTADLVRVRYYRSGSAGSLLSIEDLRGPLASGARIVHVTGITPALSGAALAATRHAVHHAHAAGIPVCLDVNHRSRLWSRGRARDALHPLAALASLVVASEDELDLVGAPGLAGEAVIADLLDRGVALVLVKRGAAGARAYTPGGMVHADAVPVTAVDTVGAGDAFTAGFLSGRLDGLDLAGCLRRAVTLGAFAVSVRGDWEGLPRRDELSLLADHGPGGAVR